MKPVDTHLSELERRIAQLKRIIREARHRSDTARGTNRSSDVLYWKGYADSAADFLGYLEKDARWLREHPL